MFACRPITVTCQCSAAGRPARGSVPGSRQRRHTTPAAGVLNLRALEYESEPRFPNHWQLGLVTRVLKLADAADSESAAAGLAPAGGGPWPCMARYRAAPRRRGPAYGPSCGVAINTFKLVDSNKLAGALESPKRFKFILGY